MVKKKSKKEEIVKESEQTQGAKEVEQSIWTVKINSQILYKKAVDGRTVLLSMTKDEKEKVAEVMSKAIDELVEILESRTTQHEAPPKREQVTRVDSTKKETVDEEEESAESDDGK